MLVRRLIKIKLLSICYIAGIFYWMATKYYLIIITLITFFAFGWDKRLAKNGRHRLSESVLLMLTFLGGTFGALFGMTFFRHKHAKKTFILKLILVVAIQLALIFFLKEKFTNRL